MNYYRGNAIYDYIQRNRIKDFHFVAGNMWQLIYGDNFCQPKLLVLVIGRESEDFQSDFSKKEIKAFRLLQKLGEQSGLPVLILKFNSTSQEIEKVEIYDSLNESGTEILLSQLSAIFKKYDLPTGNSSTSKYLNDRTSSAFHKWQRNSLGKSLTVSDIDLWKVSSKGIDCLFELKRSYLLIEKWKPFSDDYRNFELVSKTANLAGAKFKIAYNVRHKKPFEDDISRIKIFEVDFSRVPKIWEEGIFGKEAFFDVENVAEK